MKLVLWHFTPPLTANLIAYICSKSWLAGTISSWVYVTCIVALLLALWGVKTIGQSRFPEQWETYKMKRSILIAVGGALGIVLGAFLEFMFWT